MQNPDPKRRSIIAALVAAAVIVVLAIAVWAGNGSDSPSNATQPAQNSAGESGNGGQPATSAGQGGSGGVELGSLAASAYRCPSLSSPDTACIDAGPIELAAFSLTTPDGQTLTVANATRMSDGGYAWLNIPIGTYSLKRDSLQGPDGTVPRNVSGSVEPMSDGWTISNTDPNQPAIIRILFAPPGGSPAAG